ncbi:MAG: putative zinc-binding metallopeptidase [Kofleriaceae bacterium]
MAARERHLAGVTAVHETIDEIVEVLRELGVRAKLRFVWSIDGSGVEEDMPDVIHLHRTMLVAERAPMRVLAEAERYAALSLASTIRHEVGHALLFARPHDARRPAFRRMFGDVRTKYRVGTVVQEVGKRITRHGGLANPRYQHVVSLYAASHPHEQFAEAVRVALGATCDRDAIRAWGVEHGAGTRAIEQVEYAAEWLASY